jgi:hypothetical protein
MSPDFQPLKVDTIASEYVDDVSPIATQCVALVHAISSREPTSDRAVLLVHEEPPFDVARYAGPRGPEPTAVHRVADVQEMPFNCPPLGVVGRVHVDPPSVDRYRVLTLFVLLPNPAQFVAVAHETVSANTLPGGLV